MRHGGGAICLYEEASLLSFDELNATEQVEGVIFHVLSDYLSKATQDRFSGLQGVLNSRYPTQIHVHFLSDELFINLKAPNWKGNYLAYYRLFLEKVLPKECRTCLYLDIDMLVLSDLRELVALDLKDKIAGVCYDTNYHSNRIIKAKDPSAKPLQVSGDTSFNTGFMLINLHLWTKFKIFDEFFKLLGIYEPLFPDQDLLNFLLKDKVSIFSQRFNYFSALDHTKHHKDNNVYPCTEEELTKALESLSIIHYTNKPWSTSAWGIDTHYQLAPFFSLEPQRQQKWWQVALQTPFFDDELRRVKDELRIAMLELHVRLLAGKLREKDQENQKNK